MENQNHSSEANSSQNVQENVTGNDQVQRDNAEATKPGGNNDAKIFISGLTTEITKKDLQDYFAKFGAIDSIDMEKFPTTGNSKVFGFIAFKTTESVNKVIAAGDHVIRNINIDVQVKSLRYSKIFVGGITDEITDDDLMEYFGQYGKVVGVEVPFDNRSNRRRNFAFVCFESEEAAKRVLQNPKQIIGNKQVDIKRAMPKWNRSTSESDEAATQVLQNPQQISGNRQAAQSNRGGAHGFFSQRNSYGFGRSWYSPHYGNQAFNGYQSYYQGYYAAGYGGYAGAEIYGTPRFENYGSDRGGSRGGRGNNRGASRGRGEGRFQPF